MLCLQGVYDNLKLDGLWIDMNEPSNYCTGDICWNDGAAAAAASAVLRLRAFVFCCFLIVHGRHADQHIQGLCTVLALWVSLPPTGCMHANKMPVSLPAAACIHADDCCAVRDSCAMPSAKPPVKVTAVRLSHKQPFCAQTRCRRATISCA